MTQLKRRTVKAATAVLTIATIAAGARWWLTVSAAAPFQINSAKVSQGSIVDEVEATGTLQAVTTVEVGSEASGLIDFLGADFNSIVHKGQVLARLDPRLMESDVTQSKASLARAMAQSETAREQTRSSRLTLSRMQALWDKQIISLNDIEAARLAVTLDEADEKSAEAQVNQARASLEQDEVALSHAVITSPIDGIVVLRNVDVGQTVSTRMSAPTIFTLAANLDDMRVSATIDESDVGRVRAGQPVAFHVDAYPGELFHGTVKQVRLEAKVTQNVTTYAAIIDAPNNGLKLRPGMTANVAIEINRRDDVVTIPNTALRFRPTAAMYAALGQMAPAQAAKTTTLVSYGEDDEGVTYNAQVWVYANGQLSSIPVQTGISNTQVTEFIAGNIEPGMTLVTGIATKSTQPAAAAPGGLFMNMPTGGTRRG